MNKLEKILFGAGVIGILIGTSILTYPNKSLRKLNDYAGGGITISSLISLAYFNNLRYNNRD